MWHSNSALLNTSHQSRASNLRVCSVIISRMNSANSPKAPIKLLLCEKPNPYLESLSTKILILYLNFATATTRFRTLWIMITFCFLIALEAAWRNQNLFSFHVNYSNINFLCSWDISWVSKQVLMSFQSEKPIAY